MSTNFVTGDQLQDFATASNNIYNERFARKDDLVSAYKAKGSKTAAELTAALLVAGNEGYVYNLSDELVVTEANKDLFVERVALAEAEYVLTTDTVAKVGKTYYIGQQGGSNPTPIYTEVTGLTVGDDISEAGYFEYITKDRYPVGTNVVVVEESPAEYTLTEDTVAITGKTYYKSNGLIPPKYKAVEVEVGTTDVSTFFEKVDATYKFDVLGGIFHIEAVSEAEIADIIASIED